MYSLRLFSKLSSPRKLAYGPAAVSDSNGLVMASSKTSVNVEEEEDPNVEVLAGAKGSSSSLSLPVTRSASSPDLLLNDDDDVTKVVSADLSPEANKTHQYRRSNSCVTTVDSSTKASKAKTSSTKRIQPHQNHGAEISATVGSMSASAATDTLIPITTSPTPGGSSGAGVKSKRKLAGKLSWQPRTQPSTPAPTLATTTSSTRGHHRRSPSLISTPTMMSNLDGMSPPDSRTATALMPKTLRQSASFSGFSSKERWQHGGRSSSAMPKAGLGDTNNNNNNNIIGSTGSTPRNASTPGSGGRPPVNNNIGNIGGLNGSATSVTSVVNGNGNAGTPARSTSRALRYGSGAPKVPSPVQQQPESRFELEEDPSFTQDRNVQVCSSIFVARLSSFCQCSLFHNLIFGQLWILIKAMEGQWKACTVSSSEWIQIFGKTVMCRFEFSFHCITQFSAILFNPKFLLEPTMDPIKAMAAS